MYPIISRVEALKDPSLGSLGCHQHALRFKEAYA